MDLTKIKNTIKVKSPDILLGVGIVGVVVGTIEACKATKKTTAVIDEHNRKIDKIHELNEMNVTKEQHKNFQKEITKTYVSTGFKLTKLYLPASIILGSSVGCFIGSHSILSKRNLGLAAAYTALESCYKDYRDQVIDKYGEEIDRQFQYGVKPIKQKDGEEKMYKASDKTFNLNDPLVMIFDETNPRALSSAKYNLEFLIDQQSALNSRLFTRRWVSLNEAREACGQNLSLLSKEDLAFGQVKGWSLNKDLLKVDPTTGEVICDQINLGFDKNIRFLREEEKYTLLKFNCDSTLYDVDILGKK